MCTRPISKDGNTFSCRTCNECIATRRHNWVARAMMEKACHSHAICLTLTYDNSTERNRDAAKMFAYIDVREFLKRVRAAVRRADPAGQIRFICAGEQGDRRGRCHWHVIIYSSIELVTLGSFSLNGVALSVPEDIYSGASRDMRRLHWSIWPHGFVVCQKPDQGAMNYVLSYCLKDQFTADKSVGTMRETKSENFAAGLFRMSKRPALGEQWLYSRIERLAASGQCLPELKFSIPDFHGYYVPSGSFRQKALWALVALKQRVLWSTGALPPQWASLLSSLSENIPDMDILNGQVQVEETETEFAARIDLQSREQSQIQSFRNFRASCGSVLPCEACLRPLHEETLTKLGVERYSQGYSYSYRSLPGFAPLEERQQQPGNALNPYCSRRGSKGARGAFPDTGRR